MQVKVNITLSVIAQERLKVERRKEEEEEGGGGGGGGVEGGGGLLICPPVDERSPCV